MAEVSLNIGGRVYRLACRDGEEEALQTAGSILGDHVSSLIRTHGNIPEARLLLMAALLISGDLIDARKQLQQAPSQPQAPAEPQPAPQVDLSKLEELVQRAEKLAQTLEKAANPE